MALVVLAAVALHVAVVAVVAGVQVVGVVVNSEEDVEGNPVLDAMTRTARFNDMHLSMEAYGSE